MKQDTITPTRANAKLRSHGFVMIHAAAIERTRRIQANHPYELKVTGTWLPAGKPGATPQIITKAVAAGSRPPLERYARENNLTLTPTA